MQYGHLESSKFSFFIISKIPSESNFFNIVSLECNIYSRILKTAPKSLKASSVVIASVFKALVLYHKVKEKLAFFDTSFLLRYIDALTYQINTLLLDKTLLNV
tara:strand:+ start:187 stop:495 length:309 start_codon:yes stop_codon:yes gene_type:complete